jgi:hypothetical protein
VFQNTAYSASVANFARITLSSGNVFSDGATLETPASSGNPTDGYVITLTVAVSA